MAIGKIQYGRGAKGILSYVESGKRGVNLDRVDEWKTQNLIGQNQKQWLQELHAQRERSQRVEKAFGHFSISFDPNKEGKTISNDEMFRYTRRYLEEMGLRNHQAVMAIHRDTDHPHIHILINRIGDDGKAWSPWRDKFRNKEAVAKISKEFGFKIVENQSQRKVNKKQDFARSKRGNINWKDTLQERIDTALKHSKGNFETFQEFLLAAQVEIKVNSNGRGLSYKALDLRDEKGNPVIMKASKLGQGYTMNGIEKRLIEFENRLKKFERAHNFKFKEKYSTIDKITIKLNQFRWIQNHPVLALVALAITAFEEMQRRQKALKKTEETRIAEHPKPKKDEFLENAHTRRRLDEKGIAFDREGNTFVLKDKKFSEDKIQILKEMGFTWSEKHQVVFKGNIEAYLAEKAETATLATKVGKTAEKVSAKEVKVDKIFNKPKGR